MLDPAVLAVHLGRPGILPKSDLVDIRRIHEIGWWVGLCIRICCALAACRFNIQGMAQGAGSRHFRRFAVPRSRRPARAWVSPRSRMPIEETGGGRRVDGSGDGRGAALMRALYDSEL